MNGKIKVTKVSKVQMEGTFYWPVVAQCTENDQQCILDLFILWQYVQDNGIMYPESAEVLQTIANNTDDVIKKWLKLSNTCTDEKVAHYSVLLFKAIIEKIWKSGFNVDIIRHYYPVILKGARDIEEISGLGFMKMIYSQIVVIPTSFIIDGIVRKRPIQYYAVTIHVLSRKTASITAIKDFLETKDQIESKGRVIIIFI